MRKPPKRYDPIKVSPETLARLREIAGTFSESTGGSVTLSCRIASQRLAALCERARVHDLFGKVVVAELMKLRAIEEIKTELHLLAELDAMRHGDEGTLFGLVARLKAFAHVRGVDVRNLPLDFPDVEEPVPLAEFFDGVSDEISTCLRGFLADLERGGPDFVEAATPDARRQLSRKRVAERAYARRAEPTEPEGARL